MHNQVVMGDHSSNNFGRHKQQQGHRLAVPGVPFDLGHSDANRNKRMAETKIILFLANWIGYPLYIFAFISNLDNVKSTILFICAVLFFMVRTYFYIIKSKQSVREKEFDLKEKELTVMEREVVLMERRKKAAV